MVLEFDTIILGGGKGGKTLAMDLAKSGQKIAMVENNQIGGPVSMWHAYLRKRSCSQQKWHITAVKQKTMV